MPSPEQKEIIEQLNLDENEQLRTEILTTYLEDETAGANMIVKFASDKGVTITADDVVNYMETSDDEFDVEIPMELLTSISGGKEQGGACGKGCQEEAHDEPWGRCPGMRPMRKWLFGANTVPSVS